MIVIATAVQFPVPLEEDQSDETILRETRSFLNWQRKIESSSNREVQERRENQEQQLLKETHEAFK
jgi:hypothetical protein